MKDTETDDILSDSEQETSHQADFCDSYSTENISVAQSLGIERKGEEVQESEEKPFEEKQRENKNKEKLRKQEYKKKQKRKKMQKKRQIFSMLTMCTMTIPTF